MPSRSLGSPRPSACAGGTHERGARARRAVGAAAFRVERRFVEVHGVRWTLRLVRFETGWLASVDTPEGPSIGADRSPYLAASRALEPLGIGLTAVIEVLGPVGD